MDIPQEVITLGAELATLTSKKSVEAICDKIRTVKKKSDKEEVIRNLEEIVNELIEDKNDLIRIAHAYEEKLITQTITEEEIDYITSSIVPLAEKLLHQSNAGEVQKMQEGLDMIKSLLSKETLKIMQILGFNFKKAIGEPLTELVAALISSKTNMSGKTLEVQLEVQRKETELFKICQDEDAYKRLQSMYGNK